jgi:hypothetical protein
VPMRGRRQADRPLLHVLCLHAASTARCFLQTKGSSGPESCKNGHGTFAYASFNECKGFRPFAKLGDSQAISATLGKEWEVSDYQLGLDRTLQAMHAQHRCMPGHPQVQKPVDGVDPFSNVWLVLLISSASKCICCAILFRSLWQC